MSVSISFPFTDDVNYTFDPTKVEVVGGKAKLKLSNNPDQEFIQDFASDVGFTYDNTKSEFVGGSLRQKDMRPTGAALYVPFSSDLNGVWGDGVLTGTGFGGAAISGGKLDLTGGVNKYVTFASAGNVSAALQTGAIRFSVTPNYSGTPSARQNFFAIGGASTNSNLTVYHDSSTGYLYISIYNSSGTAIYSSYIQAGLYWIPVAGTEYEFELNYDITGGTIRLFINGTLWGVSVSGTGTRLSANLTNIWIGAIRGAAPAPSNNFSIRNIVFFNSVKHTGNYTPNEYIYPTIYASDIITLPEMHYTGAGALVEITDFSTISSGSPRYTLQVGRSGNYLYWDGLAWSISNGTYAQANTAAEFLANCGTLDVSDEVYGQFRIITPSGATQASIDELSTTLTAQIYALDNPSITPTTSIRLEALEGFVPTTTIAGSDNIKYALSKGGTFYYYSGGAWSVSNGTYAQSNTAAEVLANLATFTDEAVETLVKIFLHSDDGLTTPDIDNLEVLYNFAGETPSPITLITVWGYTADFLGENVENAKIKVSLDPKTVFYGNRIFTPKKQVVYSNEIGYFEFDVADTDGMSDDPYYTIKVGNKSLVVKIPASPISVALTDL
jgi:hypothetical protein